MLKLARLTWEDDGQGMTEYALILSLVASAVIFALISLGNSLSGPYQKAVSAFK